MHLCEHTPLIIEQAVPMTSDDSDKPTLSNSDSEFLTSTFGEIDMTFATSSDKFDPKMLAKHTMLLKRVVYLHMVLQQVEKVSDLYIDDLVSVNCKDICAFFELKSEIGKAVNSHIKFLRMATGYKKGALKLTERGRRYLLGHGLDNFATEDEYFRGFHEKTYTPKA